LTWICIKSIPPELYGINLEKWKKEQQRTIWIRREVPSDQLKDYIKRGAHVLETKEYTTILEEPSTKSDTAGKIFADIIIKDRVDSEILADLLKSFNWKMQDIGRPTLSYYSALNEQKMNSYFIAIEKGIKVIKSETRIIQSGSQQIVYVMAKRTPIDGILSISYLREDFGIYRFEGATLCRKEENKKDDNGNPITIDKMKIPEIYKLPRELQIDEQRIKKKIFEED
jgi:hypothetical protein